MEKREARELLKRRLAGTPLAEIARLSEEMQRRALDLSAVRACRSPLVYLSMAREARTDRLVEALLLRGARVLAPRCGADGAMEAVPLSGARLQRSRMGMEEPDGEPVDPEKIDLVLVPLLGFDASGRRLGRGGGYYDRFLRRTGCPRIGLALEMQRLDRVPEDEWDAALDAVVTERRVYKCE